MRSSNPERRSAAHSRSYRPLLAAVAPALVPVATLVLVATFVLVATIVLAATVALANPLPSGAIFVHVQPYDGSDPTAAITACEEIVQYTEATGLLEFDLFLKSFEFAPPADIISVAGSVDWPAAWGLNDFEICHGGGGTVAVVGDELQIAADFPWPTMVNEVFPLVRLVVEVDGYGELGPGICQVDYFDDEFGAGIMDVGVEIGQAGVVCDWCYQDCEYTLMRCIPHLEQSQIVLEVIQGEAVQDTVTAYVGYGQPCLPDFSTDVPGLEVTGEWVENAEWRVLLTVDATDMQPGQYAGWAKMEADCASCIAVDLLVLEASAVPDDPLVRPTTWSRLKTIYRTR